MNLLIVDDEPLEREVLMDIIQKANLGIQNCLEAINGSVAVDMVNNNGIDIVLMDIKMPVMDGIAAAKIMKKKNPNIKLLFLTAFNDFDYALQTIKLGIDDFLLKPVSPNEIIEALKKVIESMDPIITKESTSNQPIVIIRTLISYIKNHIQEKLTLEELSGLVHLHPQYISRLFKQEMNMTITEYITVERIEKSKKMLVETQNTMMEISIACGFSDSNYFTRVFRMREGIPPSQYRKNELLLKKERLHRQYFNKIM